MVKQLFLTSEPLDERTSRPWLVFILATGLALRVGICFFTSLPHIITDTSTYFAQADTLLAGGYTNFFPNGYPFIIALVKILFHSHTELALRWLQIGLGVATIWFVYEIARRLSGRYSYALLAAAILAVFPSQLNYTRWLTSEVPATFFLVGGFFFYYRRKWLAAGLLLGVGIVVRNNLEPIAFVLILVHIFHTRKLPWVLAAATLLPLLLIGSYCRMKTGNFSTAGTARVNILIAISASGPNVNYTDPLRYPEVHTPSQALHLYVEHAKAEPLVFVRQRLSNCWELWGFYASSPPRGHRSTMSRLVLGAGNFFLVVLGIWGWWGQSRNYPVSILIIPFVVLTCLHTMLFAMVRFTCPVEPFLILLDTWALERLFSNGKNL